MNRWTARGTHLGDLFGLPPTGKRVEFTGISIFRIVKGKIVNDWAETDNLFLMQQLGFTLK